MTVSPAHRKRRRIPRAAVLVAVMLVVGLTGLLPLGRATAGPTTLIDDSFANPTSDSQVVYASNGNSTLNTSQPLPCLTAGPASGASTIPNCDLETPDSPGSGALMLTDGGFGEASNIIYDSSFPTADGLDITFDTHMYGGSALDGVYADGISFDLAVAPRTRRRWVNPVAHLVTPPTAPPRACRPAISVSAWTSTGTTAPRITRDPTVTRRA